MGTPTSAHSLLLLVLSPRTLLFCGAPLCYFCLFCFVCSFAVVLLLLAETGNTAVRHARRSFALVFLWWERFFSLSNTFFVSRLFRLFFSSSTVPYYVSCASFAHQHQHRDGKFSSKRCPAPAAPPPRRALYFRAALAERRRVGRGEREGRFSQPTDKEHALFPLPVCPCLALKYPSVGQLARRLVPASPTC